jgi:hypothetical protein
MYSLRTHCFLGRGNVIDSFIGEQYHHRKKSAKET